jgi:hypothetical protein
MRRLATFGLTSVLALAISSAAHAALIAQFTGTTPSGSDTTYNYNLVFSTNNGLDRLDAGSGSLTPGAVGSADFITLYDVGLSGPTGNLVGITAGAGFSGTIQNPGVNAAQTLPIDDALLSNVTFKYTGPAISTDTVFGGFGITVKNNDGTTLKQFTAQYTDNQGPELDTKIGQIGLVAVPQGASIPEPGTVALGLMGALGLVARRRRLA